MSRHTTFLHRLIALCACLGALATTAAADVIEIEINAQPLDAALRELARQSGIQIAVQSALTEGKSAQALAGKYEPKDALTRLLEGTDLVIYSVNETTYGIRAQETKLNRTSMLGASEVEGDQSWFTRLRLAQSNATQSDSSRTNDEDTAPSSSNSRAPALEEIVVTAEKRAESIQSLPIAISAFSGETLGVRGIEGIATLPQLAPSTQVWVQPGAGVRLAIRGISNEVGETEPSTAMVQDGVPYATMHLSDADFFDVERIEVLRGPQGTISGRNATAGALYVHSNRPSEEFEGGIKATLGNYDRLGVEGYLSGPVAGDRLLGRLAVRTDRADGWATNALLDEELGTRDKVQARASLLAHLTDDLEAHLILEGFRDRSTPFYSTYVDVGRLRPDTPTLTEALGIPTFDRDSNTAQLNSPTHYDNERSQTTLRLAWQLGPSAQLTAITGYVDLDSSIAVDSEGTPEPLEEIDDISFSTRQVSQEVTLTADLTDRLDLILGALYLDSDEQFFIDGTAFEVIRFEVPQDRKLTSWGGYTQWRYRLTDAIRLTAGVRYTHDSKDFAQDVFVNGVPLGGAANDRSWNAWTPRFVVDYAPSDDLTLYASVSRGFKSGALQPTSTVNPEFVWNYEAGVKANWLDERLKTTLTGFYMDYTDLQQSLFFFDSDLTQTRADLINAKSATIAGAELEIDALVTEQLRFTFAGTWLDATYGELRTHDTLFPELGVPTPDGVTLRDLSGNRVVRSPEWQFNVSGEYRAPLGFLGGDLQGVLRASYAWQDRVFYDIFNRQATSQGAYGLINLFGAIETTDGRWQLAAFVHNLANQHYYTSVQALIGLAPVPYSNAWIGAPRQYGISLAYHF